ncbi:hypothetical protein L218DRAFT_829689, partial [Marasmius fiardii PR-910]
LDITPYATPRRYRLISLTALRYQNTLEIYEFEELPMYKQSHCFAVSYVWRGVSLNPDPNHPASRRARQRGTFTVKGGEDGDPISLSVLDDISWAAESENVLQTLLWLDQLCIMQTSKDDKAWQIQRMYHIFSTSKVIVLPGGLQRLASLDDETSWMNRAWTLQETL